MTITRTEEQKKNTSFHEAGHAVMAVCLKKKFNLVTIIPNEENNTAGHFDFGQQSPILVDGIAEAINYTKIYLASLHTESINLNMHPQKLIERGGFEMDSNCIHAMLSQCMDSQEIYFFINWVSHRTRVDVQARWKYVEAVAKELQRKETLTFDEVKKIMDSVK